VASPGLSPIEGFDVITLGNGMVLILDEDGRQRTGRSPCGRCSPRSLFPWRNPEDWAKEGTKAMSPGRGRESEDAHGPEERHPTRSWPGKGVPLARVRAGPTPVATGVKSDLSRLLSAEGRADEASIGRWGGDPVRPEGGEGRVWISRCMNS
jgi:hypothetical protein